MCDNILEIEKSKIMRILQIVPSVSLVYGGPSQMVIGLSKALAKEDIKVTLITTNSNGDQGQLPLDVPLQVPIQQDGYEIIYFNCSPFRRYKFSLDLLNWLKINAKNYDLAHIHALFSPVSTFSARVCHQKNLPYILRPLGTLDPKDLEKKKKLKYLYANLLEKNNLTNSAGVHFTSQTEADVSETFGAKINPLVVPLAVEIPEKRNINHSFREKLAIPLDKTLILFMSRIEPKKGLDLLIPSLENLVKKGLDFHFVLAGSNPQDQDYEHNIKQIIANSELKNRTTIAGFVSGENKLDFLQSADLFVLPSYYENFGIAVVEAMAMGLPVLISDQVYIWQDINKADAGWICQCNQEDLTEKLHLALNSREEMKIKGNNAQKLVKNQYTWKAIARQMITVYQQLSNNS